MTGVVKKKKLPMNKIHVGAAPSPNLMDAKPKVGSFENATHKPGGGDKKIFDDKYYLMSSQSTLAANEF